VVTSSISFVLSFIFRGVYDPEPEKRRDEHGRGRRKKRDRKKKGSSITTLAGVAGVSFLRRGEAMLIGAETETC
jgi:hypothetical protein